MPRNFLALDLTNEIFYKTKWVECFYTHAYLPNHDNNNKYFHMSK